MKKIRVLHVDDSSVIRGLIRKILLSDNGIEALDPAVNGRQAIELYKKHQPDIVVMDIEMPEMNGIDALKEIIAFDPKAKVLMCSTLTLTNAEISLKAMKIGAIDYIAKPTSTTEIIGANAFQEKLLHTIKNIINPLAKSEPKKLVAGFAVSDKPINLRPKPPLHWKPKIIAIGSSTGGPQALMSFLKSLGECKLPVVITQHMPPTFTTLLAKQIDEQTAFECLEAESGQVLKAGRAILARGGMHMEFTKNAAGQIVVNVSDGPAENFCKPAVDPMLRSLVKYYNHEILTVILTGMGQDGQKGTEQIVQAGGICVAQDQASSIVWGMPGAVAGAGLCSAVLPLDEIAGWVKNAAKI